MTQFINPYSSRQYINANSVPYTGAKLFVYLAGTSTKYTTTKDQAGTSSHTNPIILNSRGEAADGAGASQAIWQTGGDKVKLVLAPSTDTDPPVSAISTWDNLQGVNDNTITQDQWVSGPAPTYISATSFTLIGDQTNAFHVGRRLRSTNTAGTIYSTITVVAYTTLTTVTIRNDSGVLDSGLSAVSYGLLSVTNNSIPGGDRKALTLYSQGIGPFFMQNIGVDATVAAKAMTFSLLTKDGATPTATDKAQIEHRDPTVTTGRTVTREATAATTLLVPSTATLGFVANETAFTHLYSIWSAAGGLEVAVIKNASINEGELQSTTAISTASDSGGVLYSTTARTGATVRFIGRFKVQTGAVAGEWDNAPTEKVTGVNTVVTSQVAFPATQVLSDNVNTLDDYEEGTWTPSLGGSATYTTQAGTYTKIGNLVFIRGILAVNVIGTGSTTLISGGPFSPQNSSCVASCSNFASLATAVVWLIPRIDAGSPNITISSLTAAATNLGVSAIFGNGTTVSFSVIFHV